ncbi:MAG: MFS transporter [Bacteroidaceae bacterium]
MEKQNKMTIPAIFSVALLTVMASTAISPALSTIKNAFPYATDTQIKLVLTLPSLVMIPFSFISGWLSSKIDIKKVLYLGIIIYLIFGIGGCFATSLNMLLVIRAGFGISIGLLMPLANTLIFDLVEPDRRSKILGLSSSVNQLGGVIVLSLAGVLASMNWRYSFLVYAFAFVSMFFVYRWIPNLSSLKVVEDKKISFARGKLNWKVFALAFLAMVSSLSFFVINTDLSLYLQDRRMEFATNLQMFSSRQALLDAIKKGKIDNNAKMEFKKNKIHLSRFAYIVEVTPKKEWRICDFKKDYSIVKENGKLKIYSMFGTPQLSGILLSIMGIPAVLAGLILSYVLKKIKFYLMPLAAGLMAIGYFLLAIAFSVSFIIVAVLFIGLAGGLLTPPMMLLIPKMVSLQSRTLAIAILSSSILLGQFVSPLFVKGMGQLLGMQGFVFNFSLIAMVMGIGAVGGFFYVLFYNKFHAGMKKI